MVKPEVKYQRKLGKKHYYIDQDQIEDFDEQLHLINTANYQKKIGKKKIKEKYQKDEFNKTES